MADARVVAIIVNWKLKQETVQCIKSLECLNHPCDIIVVDNGSNDGSVEYIRRHYRQVELLALPSNIGFGSACNRAIAKILQEKIYDYVFLFNNDATLHPGALTELLKVAQAHPRAGILGAKVYYRDRPDRIWYAGARRRQGVLAATDIGRGHIDEGQFNTLREVDYIFGAAMLIRCAVFEEIGLFDERFFLYLEDLDFCLRAQAAGFSLLFVPKAYVWHRGSASTAKSVTMRRFYMAQSTIRFLRKHSPSIWGVPVFAFWVIIYLKDILGDLINGNLGIIKACLTGLLTGLNEVGDL